MKPERVGGRYRLERPIGRGGMAIVYLAHDERLERPVAVKILSDNLAADAGLVRRFHREARSAAALCHPNIVQVFDVCREQGRHSIVMEYVAGGALEAELACRGRYAPSETVRIGLDVCSGLSYAHEAGVVHRDIKPANLLRARDGAVKVADFGIARVAAEATLTEAGSIVGTLAYLPPEQALGDEATPAADIYALGAVLYQLLTGRVPYQAASLLALAELRQQGTPPPASQLAAGVPPELDRVIGRCLAVDPQSRPRSASDLAAALEELPLDPAARSITRAAPLPAERPTVLLPRRRRRLLGRRALWSLGVVSVLASLGSALALQGTTGVAGSTQRGVRPAPQLRDPARQARALAQWLREIAPRSS